MAVIEEYKPVTRPLDSVAVTSISGSDIRLKAHRMSNGQYQFTFVGFTEKANPETVTVTACDFDKFVAALGNL